MEKELCVLAKLYLGNESLFELHPNEKGTKKERLFHLFITQPNGSKAFYRSELFGEAYKGTGYEVLRNELSSTLLNELFKVKSLVSGVTNSERIKLVKQIFGLRLLRVSGDLESRQIFGLIKKLLRRCEKLELRSEQMQLVMLCLHVSGLIGDRESFNFYKSKLVYLQEVMAIEDSLYIAQAEWFLALRSDKHISEEKISFFENELDRISNILSSGTYDSGMLEFKVLGLRIHLADVKKDFRSLIDYAKQGLSYFGKIPVATVRVNMTLYLAYAYANLGNEQEFTIWEKKAYQVLDGKTLKHAELAEMSFAFRMSRREFELAYETWHLFFRDEGYKLISESKRDAWDLFLLYLKFASKVKIWRATDTYPLPESKKISELNLGPLKTNKVGTNISLIVLEFCEDLLDENFEKLLSIEEALKRYISRNLKTLNERPRVFLGMLLKVIKLDFNPFEIEKKTRKQLEKLRTMDPNFNMDIGGNEIIRYEVLWEWILKKLKESSLLPKPKA